MKVWKKTLLASLVATGIGCSAALAQPADTTPATPGPGYGMMMRGHGGGAGFAQNLAYLHQKLALSPQQEATWQTFSKKVLDLKEKQWSRAQANWEKMSSSTLPERLDLRDAMFKEREADRAQMHKELKDFYNTLSPEQKIVFDQNWQPGGMHNAGFRGKGPRGDGPYHGRGGRGGMGNGGCWQ